MYLLFITLGAVIALNLWYRRWLRQLSDQKRQQALNEISAEAQRWQL